MSDFRRLGRAIVGVAASLGLFAASACGTLSGNGSTSPYFNPPDGRMYVYGNFCGPANPTFRSPRDGDVEDRIRQIHETQPIDDIDLGCRVHDLCYELLGHDRKGCDNIMYPMLAGSRGFFYTDGIADLELRQCIDLAKEISLAVTNLKLKGNAAEDPSRLAGAVGTIPGLAIFGPFQGARGWPRPGACPASPDRKASGTDQAYWLFIDAGAHIACNVDIGTVGLTPRFAKCIADARTYLSTYISLDDVLGNSTLTRAKMDRVMAVKATPQDRTR